jgi:hypothetical protein
MQREPVLLAVEESKKMHHHSHHHSDPEFEFMRKKKHAKQPSPSPLLTFLAGGKRKEPTSAAKQEDVDEIIDHSQVDDLLAEYTTIFDKDGKQKIKIKVAGEKDTEEDKLDEDFLRSTRLDDYFSDDDTSESSNLSTVRFQSRKKVPRFKVSWIRAFSKMRLRRRARDNEGGRCSSLEDD